MTTEMRAVEIDGRAFRWRQTGSGPPLVLVHGLAGSWRWWRPVLPQLAERSTVHVLDLPGFGRLPRARWFDIDAAVEWLARWLEAADVAPADVVGHSLGGLLCARLAARHPETVRRLVLVAPAGVPGHTVAGATLPLARAVLASRPSFVALLARDAVRSGPVTTLSAALAVLAADVRADLADVRAPTLVILGRTDPLVPLAQGNEVARTLRNAELRVLEAEHVPMVDLPDEFSREVLAFLAAP
ncbi:MAG: alpha/beta fold hydrolase [Actinobacteria bacterium]|nr:alpha/beta fold hydrolase [Actinomycetota bacterium]